MLDEDSPFNLERLRVDYVHAKREAEHIAKDAAARGRHVVIVNPGYLLGPEDYQGLLARLHSRFPLFRAKQRNPDGRLKNQFSGPKLDKGEPDERATLLS